MKQLKDLAFASRNNPQECLALYVELLEAHIQQQDRLMETFKQELDEVIIELSTEQS
jgi:hypothetical protein